MGWMRTSRGWIFFVFVYSAIGVGGLGWVLRYELEF